MKRTRVLSCLLAALVLPGAGGCRQSTTADASTDPVSAPHRVPVGAVAMVHISPEMAAEVHVEPVGLKSAPGTLRATGKVQFDEARVARIVAPVAGRVTRLDVKVGDRARRGEPLFFLNSRDAAQALEDYASGHHDLDLADKTLTMIQDLFDHQAAARIALEQAKTDVAKAQARVERTRRSLDAIGLHPDDSASTLSPNVPVISPIEGIVIDRHLSDGQYVQPDPTPLMTIADLSTVWVEADIFERDLHLLQVGQTAEVTTNAYPDAHFTARVARIGDVLDAASRTAKVRFSVSNLGRYLKPEMFATVTLAISDAERAITVPASAVLTEGDRTFIYVAVDQQTFARRQVNIAADTRDSRRVLGGLTEDDRVVTVGALLLRQQENHSTN